VSEVREVVLGQITIRIDRSADLPSVRRFRSQDFQSSNDSFQGQRILQNGQCALSNSDEHEQAEGECKHSADNGETIEKFQAYSALRINGKQGGT
jgi:hypothetical protein